MIDVALRSSRGDFSLDVAFTGSSGVTALFGSSGCGKTTVIRLVAGLDRPDAGHVIVGDHVLLDRARRIDVPTHRRRIGLVFQDAQLFPHLSVATNLGYGRFFTRSGLRRIDWSAVIEVLGIGHLLDRRPDTLSGGEKQRVAIGRALLMSPDLLLMDEPLASLDDERKLEILPFIERLRDEFAIPILYVSHSVEEVVRLATTVVRLAAGRVTAIGSPSEVLAPTALAHTTGRFETVSVITGRIGPIDRAHGVTTILHPAGHIVVPALLPPSDTPLRILINATDVVLARPPTGATSLRTELAARVASIAIDDGPLALVKLDLVGAETLYSYVTRLAVDALRLAPGDEVTAMVKSVSIDEKGLAGLAASKGNTP